MNLKNEKKGTKKVKSKKRNRKQGATSHIWAGPLARAGGGGAACTFFSSSDYVWNTGLFFKKHGFLFLEHRFDIPIFLWYSNNIFKS